MFELNESSFNYSDNLKSGIIWKIVDGWFSLPDVFIATQGEEYYRNLSPNSEFNWGNKLGIYYKHY